MADKLRCLNCGAPIKAASVSRSRRFAKCRFCGSIHNVGEYFASQGREAAELTAAEDIARAERELPSGIEWIVRAYSLVAMLVLGAVYFPAAMMFMFSLAGTSYWPFVLAAVIGVPLFVCPLWYWLFHRLAKGVSP
ncbi:MAG: hypothetical protein KDB82_03205 [Planctomycetes bacterium]|nr:hypothetical protein [Planctomycetota bacterium]